MSYLVHLPTSSSSANSSEKNPQHGRSKDSSSTNSGRTLDKKFLLERFVNEQYKRHNPEPEVSRRVVNKDDVQELRRKLVLAEEEIKSLKQNSNSLIGLLAEKDKTIASLKSECAELKSVLGTKYLTIGRSLAETTMIASSTGFLEAFSRLETTVSRTKLQGGHREPLGNQMQLMTASKDLETKLEQERKQNQKLKEMISGLKMEVELQKSVGCRYAKILKDIVSSTAQKYANMETFVTSLEEAGLPFDRYDIQEVELNPSDEENNVPSASNKNQKQKQIEPLPPPEPVKKMIAAIAENRFPVL